MSSFKVVTTIETVGISGNKKDQSWTAVTASLTDVVWSNVQVSTSARIFIWNPTVWPDFTPTAYATLMLVANGTLDVEMGIQVGDAAVEYNSFRLVKDTPMVLGSNAGYYDHASTTDAAFGGTLGTINSIRVDEPGTESVNLVMVMGV